MSVRTTKRKKVRYGGPWQRGDHPEDYDDIINYVAWLKSCGQGHFEATKDSLRVHPPKKIHLPSSFFSDTPLCILDPFMGRSTTEVTPYITWHILVSVTFFCCNNPFQCSQSKIAKHARTELSTRRPAGGWRPGVEALVNYYTKRRRGRGYDFTTPKREFPFDGHWEWASPKAKKSTVTYNEGPGDREWMEEADVIYKIWSKNYILSDTKQIRRMLVEEVRMERSISLR